MRFNNLIGATLMGASALFDLAQASIAVTGVQDNGVQVRMELRTMQRQHPDMFNVYLLGLRSLMETDQTEPQSYYQIAGIHGRPYIPWDDVGTAPGDGAGYCTHTSNLFLTWHRPYLALYEQALYSHVQKVANSFPAGSRREKYVAAAKNFRIPYWDWAAAPCSECKAWPLLVSNQYAYVDTPTGQEWVLNPLFRYDFHPATVADMAYDPFATWQVTKRYPTNWTAQAVSQNNLVAPQIANNQVSARDRLYNLLTSYDNFSQFGNEAWITSSTTNADSLESLHDVIHAISGNNGHMSYLDFSAFDPVFWLHHAMIDRAFSLWQAVHTDSYVEPMAAVGGTFTYPKGTVRDVNSPLAPFHYDTEGSDWTSANVVKTDDMGYTYPEIANGASAASVRSAINKLYGNTAASSTISKRTRNRHQRSEFNNVTAAAAVQNAVSQNGTSYQYIANIVSQKFGMGSSYAVYLFMGNHTSQSTHWAVDSNLVGIHGVFANMKHNDSWATVKSMGMDDLKATGSIPLTTMLIDKVATGQLASLSPEHVEPYLTHALDWRVSYYDGTEIPVESVIDLSVSVVQSRVTPAVAEDEFPVWGEFKALVNVTSSKPGGHNSQYWNCPEDGTPYGPDYGNTSSAVPTSSTATPEKDAPVTITITSTTFLPLASCETTCAGTSTFPSVPAYATSAY